MSKVEIIITCEHAGNDVPSEYSYLFKENEQVLNTHRALDLGIEAISETFVRELKTKYFYTKTTRLLVDCNRSDFRDDLLSEFALKASEKERKEILNTYYYPYRQKVEKYIANSLLENRVLHLSMHSFTPELNGEVRRADVGLLLDESRKNEKDLCLRWLQDFHNRMPNLITALNEPYQGANDGFTTHFRNEYGDDQYLGIEIEINQKWTEHIEIKEITHALIDFLKSDHIFNSHI